MKIKLMNGNVLEMLRNIPDESVDCVVSSPPYYGLRDYSSVETISAKTEQAVIDLTDTKIREYEKKYAGYRFHHNDPQSNDEKKTWFCTIRIDIDAVWDADPECEHEWKEISNGRTDETGFERNRKGLNNAAETLDGNKRNAVSRLAPVTHDSNVCFKCHAWKGQLGLEPTYKMFIEHLLLITNELKRVLKPTGTLFWNMGDTYSGAGQKETGKAVYEQKDFRQSPIKSDLPNKSLMMIPERLAMGMIDQGWILRNKLIWYKPNGMPSSVRDRFSNKWEYIFFFSKNGKYYFDLDSVRKPLSEGSIKRISQKNIPNQLQSGKTADFALTTNTGNIPKILNNMHQKYEKEGSYTGKHSGYKNLDGSDRINENGANPGDVLKEPAVRHKSWVSNAGHNFTHKRKYDPDADGGDFLSIVTRAHPFAHFAVYPETLIEPLINAGCPKEVCSKCGKPKMPFREKTGRTYDSRNGEYTDEGKYISRKIAETNHVSESSVFRTDLIQETKTVMKPSCSCNANFISGTVLDPFNGSGTTMLVARNLGRSAIGIDVNPIYSEIVKKRLQWGMGLDIEYAIGQVME